MKTFKVKRLYLYKFMSQCLPIYAYYTMLFVERDMTVSEIAALLAIWSMLTILFEIPSGVLADRWNRRNMLAIAAVLQGLCFLIWYVSHTFLMFAAGFVFWAASGAFTSGTEEGLIYDNLKYDGHEEEFTRVYGKAQFFANAGTIAGIASAGLMASFISIGTMALLSVAICFVNVMFILQIREINFYSEHLPQRSIGYFKTCKDAGAFIKGSGGVLASILFLIFFINLGSYLDEFDALIINNLQLSNVWVSVILTIRFIFLALGDLFAPFIQKQISSMKQVFLLSVLAYIFLAFFAIWWSQFAFVIFGLALMVLAITEILLVNALQNEIKEEGRATVISFYGVGQNVVMLCFSFAYALLAGVFTLQQVYLIISFYGMMGGLSFFLLLQRVKSRS